MTVVLVVSLGIVTGSAFRSPAPSADAAVCPSATAPVTAPGPTMSDDVAVSSELPAQLVAQPQRLQLLPLFRRWAAVCAVPAALVEATCWWESGWQEDEVSDTGAVGVCQIEPDTTRAVRALLGDEALDPRSASDNIEMSAAYLRWLLDQTGGRQDLALAGYYQGITSLREHGVLPVSRPYVAGIDALLHEYTWT
jgi:soluble lytic murein transglycosylase-like protein